MTEELLFERDDDGTFRAVLPSGKRPVIVPVLAHTIRRIYDAFSQPEVPHALMEVKGIGMAQKVETPNDPAYTKALVKWYTEVQWALFQRFVMDALVVPDDDEWAWKLAKTGVPIPEPGPDRQDAYVEEVLPELVTDGLERKAFVDAVRAISVPTEAGIRAARRRFHDEVGEDTAGESEDEGGDNSSEA